MPIVVRLFCFVFNTIIWTILHASYIVLHVHTASFSNGLWNTSFHLSIFISLESWSNPAPSMKGQLQLFFPWNRSCSRTEGLVSTWPYAKPFVFTVLNLHDNLAMLVLWGGKKILFSRRRKLKLNEIHYLAHDQAAPYSMEEPDPDPRTC